MHCNVFTMLQENEVRKVDIYKWSEHMTSITSSNRETLAHGTLPRESRHNQTEILATLDFTTSAEEAVKHLLDMSVKMLPKRTNCGGACPESDGTTPHDWLAREG